jgi:integrase
MDDIRVNRYSTTYNNYRRKLKRVLESIGYSNLFSDIDKIKENRRPARYFQRSQIDKLKPIIADKWPDLLLFCELQYYCFIRPKEARNLRAEHVLIDAEQILIIGDESKNKDSEYIVIPDQMVPRLQYIKNMPASNFIFPGVINKNAPIGENTMWRRHNDILKKLKFGKGFCLYSWKHTGAFHYIQNGGNVVQLSKQMRHHSLDQTMEYLRSIGVNDLGHIKANMPTM